MELAAAPFAGDLAVAARHHWQWIVGRPDGSNVAELTEARTRRLELSLDNAGQATWTMPGRHRQTRIVTELSTDMAIARDRLVLFRGRIGASEDTLSPNVHTTTFAAVDYRGMLERRIIWPGSRVAFGGNEQTNIARALVDDTQALGSLGITHDTTITGVMRERNYEAGQNVGELIGNLGRTINGFEWDVSPAKVLRFFYPERGNPVPVILEYGRDLAEVRRTVTSTKFANALRYSGNDEIAAVTRTLAPGPEGRFERQDGNPDVSQTATLNQQADGTFARVSQIRPAYRVTLVTGRWDPARLWLGDTVRLLTRSGRLDVDTVLRIVGLVVELDEEEVETVQLELGAREPSFAERLNDTSARLDRLERR